MFRTRNSAIGTAMKAYPASASWRRSRVRDGLRTIGRATRYGPLSCASSACLALEVTVSAEPLPSTAAVIALLKASITFLKPGGKAQGGPKLGGLVKQSLPGAGPPSL